MIRRLIVTMMPAVLVGTSPSNPAFAQEKVVSEPSSAIGQIVCVSGQHSMTTTATVIEDRSSLLTVSHFNYDHRTRSSIAESNCSFILRSENGTIAFKSSFKVATRGARGADIAFSRATDWAVLKLTTPVDQQVEPVIVAFDHDTSQGSEVSLKGYQGRLRQIVERKNCRPTARSAGSAILDHSCRTSPGLSGAPLFAQTADGLRLVAIHSARDGDQGLAVLIKGFAARSIRRRNSAEVS